MVVSNSPGISQQKMNYLFQEFKLICSYIDGILIFTKGYCTYNVD